MTVPVQTITPPGPLKIGGEHAGFAFDVFDGEKPSPRDEVVIAPTTPTTPAPPAASIIPAWLKSELAELGLPASFTDTLSAEQATQLVVSERKREAARAKVADEVRRAKVADEPTPENPKPQTKPKFDWGTDADGEPYADDDIPLILKRFIPAFDAKIKALESEVLRLRSVEAAGHANAAEDAADRVFAKYPKVFGDGGRTAVDRKSPEFLRRRQCYLAAREMFTNMPPEVRDASGMTMESAIETMAKALYGVASDATPSVPPPPTNGRPTPEQWSRGGLGVPTPRDTPPKGDAKSERGIQSWLESHGLDDKDQTTLDEFV